MSLGHNPGSFSLAKTSGTLSASRLKKSIMQFRWGGSLLPNAVERRYCVWPEPIVSGSYSVTLNVLERADVTDGKLLARVCGVISRSPGSVQVYIGNSAGGLATVGPGTVTVVAHP